VALKAKLSIILKADDVVVAATDDIMLWVQILTTLSREAAQGHGSHLPSTSDVAHMQQVQHEVVQNFS
jgi:hypothetical protein